MKKILALFMGVFMLAACSSEEQTTFKGFEYKMLNAPNNAEVTLSFDSVENRFFGKVVNRYFGTYEVDGNNITFGPAASTLMMGPAEQMEAEYELLKALPTMKIFKFEGKKLIFTSEDGNKLEFEKIGEVKSEK